MTEETKIDSSSDTSTMPKISKCFVGWYKADWLRRELREGGGRIPGLDCIDCTGDVFPCRC